MEPITTEEKINELAQMFAQSSEMLRALGDETRQHMILEMMKMGECGGVRVGKIAEKTNLSRPAVSHHIRILKQAGLVKVRRDGSKNYYYLDPGTEKMELLADTLQCAVEIARELPERKEE